MLRRTRRSGFVPGAWVFAGGRVDESDADVDALARLNGVNPDDAARRLGMSAGSAEVAGAYYLAALRETFEETGLIIGHGPDGRTIPGAGDDPGVAGVRDDLLSGQVSFPTALDRLQAQLDGGAVEYIGHWITPVQEPRRYDTRFFAAQVDARRKHLLHPSEMTDSLWLSPGSILDRHAAGEIPMVFPTIRTLEDLSDFETASSVLAHFQAREIPAILPRLVKTSTGVGLELPDRE